MTLTTQATPRNVGKGRGPAHDSPPPVRIVGAIAEGLDHQVAALVDDATPELAPLPPPLIPGIGPQDQQGAQSNAHHLVRGHRNGDVGKGRMLFDERDQQCDEAEDHRAPPNIRRRRVFELANLGPEPFGLEEQLHGSRALESPGDQLTPRWPERDGELHYSEIPRIRWEVAAL